MKILQNKILESIILSIPQIGIFSPVKYFAYKFFAQSKFRRHADFSNQSWSRSTYVTPLAISLAHLQDYESFKHFVCLLLLSVVAFQASAATSRLARANRL